MGMSLAFYKAKYGGWMNKLIDLFTGRRGYSHVEIVFSDDLSFSSSPSDGGCRFKKIDYATEAKEWDLIPVPMGLQDEDIIRMFCQKQEGMQYDWSGALGVPFHYFRQQRDRWFCTEVIISAFQQVGVMVPLKPKKFSPNKFSVLANRPGIWARYF